MLAPAPGEQLGNKTAMTARPVVGRERDTAAELRKALRVDQRRRVAGPVVEMHLRARRMERERGEQERGEAHASRDERRRGAESCEIESVAQGPVQIEVRAGGEVREFACPRPHHDQHERDSAALRFVDAKRRGSAFSARRDGHDELAGARRPSEIRSLETEDHDAGSLFTAIAHRSPVDRWRGLEGGHFPSISSRREKFPRPTFVTLRRFNAQLVIRRYTFVAIIR